MSTKWIQTDDMIPGWYFAITRSGKFTILKYNDKQLLDYKSQAVDQDQIIASCPLGNEMFYAISICKGNIREAGELLLAEKVAQSFRTA